MILERKFRVPRCWSNQELLKMAHLFQGSIANVSGWMDADKEGKKYKDYFTRASEYWITNYKPEARGFQGNQTNEIYLDLAAPLEQELKGRFDVVFNHTVLEHVFKIETAFTNLCSMSKDVVVIVVPFLQEQHGAYGDYWRFTPQAVEKLFSENGLTTLYMNFNDSANASIYLFAVGARCPERWDSIVGMPGNQRKQIATINLGTKLFKVSWFERTVIKLFKILRLSDL